jgi:hypothetical protein
MKMLVFFATIIALAVLITPWTVVYGENGAVYKVNLGNISSEQCIYASTSVRDIKFLGITTEIDPCTLDTVYLYNYQITWKTDSEQWLSVHLGKSRIAPVSIQTGKKID